MDPPARLHPAGRDRLQRIKLYPFDILLEVGLVIGIPFVVGLTIVRFWPPVAAVGRR